MRIRNWETFQHYKHRSPPWIRLYRTLLDNPEWFALPGGAAKLLVELWLMASEKDGELPASGTLAWRLRRTSDDVETCLKSLIDRDFIIPDSVPLATCGQDASKMLLQSRVEESREEEIREEEKMPAAAPQPFAIVVEDESMGNGVTWTSTTVGDWNGGNVMDAYVQYCRRKGWPDPPTGQRAKLGAAGKRLASKSAPVEIIAAMVGMEQLFPYSKGEPWDLMDLEHKFTKAVAASENNPEIQRRRFERAFLGGEAT